MKLAVLSLAIAMTAGGAQALVPADCNRVTHVSHGGESDHVDLGEGRVMWRTWWSQEGTATDIAVMECGLGQVLIARTAEENMGRRGPLERTDDALAVIARHETGSRVFAALERIADDLTGMARDVRVEDWTVESCACAAFYPDLRGDKTNFRLEGL